MPHKQRSLTAFLLLTAFCLHQQLSAKHHRQQLWGNDDPSLSPPPQRNNRLVLLLHFHKVAGSSFTELAWQNNETVLHKSTHHKGTPDRHGHLEIGLGGTFRWDMISWPFQRNSSNCTLPSQRLPHVETEQAQIQEQAQRLNEEMTSLHKDGISFLSTEHWFPPTQVLDHIDRSTVSNIVLFRDPMERLLSSFRFHPGGGGRCKSGGSCSFAAWWPAEANLYVKQLNGVPHGPAVPTLKHAVCVQKLLHFPPTFTQVDYDWAEQSLERHFDVVLTLDSVRRQSSRVACVLHQFLGWNVTVLPSTNVNHKHRQSQLLEALDSNELQRAREENMWDLRLYARAVQLEEEVFQRFHC